MNNRFLSGDYSKNKNIGILGNYLVEDSLAKFIEKGLKKDDSKTLKERKHIRILLQNAAAKYIDLKRFREDFDLIDADYKTILDYFLLNFDEVTMYGNRLYAEYRCYKSFDSFHDDAIEEGYAEEIEPKQKRK